MYHGKRLFTWNTESGYYVKGERETKFTYSTHTSYEDNSFILYTRITPVNVHNNQIAMDLIKQSKRDFPNIKRIITDDGYKNPKIIYFLSYLKLYPILPYTASNGVKEGGRKKNFVNNNAYFRRKIFRQRLKTLAFLFHVQAILPLSLLLTFKKAVVLLSDPWKGIHILEHSIYLVLYHVSFVIECIFL